MAFMRGEPYIYEGSKLEIHYKGEHIGLPFAIFDELVVMHFAELSPSQIKKAELRAIKKHYGNIGCDAIAKKHGLKTIIEQLDEVTSKNNSKEVKTKRKVGKKRS